VLPDEEPPPALPAVAELLPDPPEALEVPEVLGVLVPEIEVAAVVDAVCSTVLPVPLASDVEFAVLDSSEDDEVVVRPELLEVMALTPEVDVAVSWEVPVEPEVLPLPPPLPPEEVDEDDVLPPCR
jgi:hypothetical protein